MIKFKAFAIKEVQPQSQDIIIEEDEEKEKIQKKRIGMNITEENYGC